MSLIFDIETGPVDEQSLRSLYAEPTWEEFSASCDQRWKEDTKREKFEAAKASGWQSFVDKAALSPLTGRVLAIGFASADDPSKVSIAGAEGTEAELLAAFWRKYRDCRAKNPPRKLLGWNIHGFDLPFLVKRSWLLGVEVPSTLRDANDRYWDSLFVDLMARFAVGEWKANCKLDLAARFFGCGAKNGEGKDFARLWNGTADERQQAVDYLRNDLAMTAGIAKRIGVA